MREAETLTQGEGVNYIKVLPFIPPRSRRQVTNDAHKTHPGRQATKTALKEVAWLPGMSQEVEQKNRPL